MRYRFLALLVPAGFVALGLALWVKPSRAPAPAPLQALPRVELDVLAASAPPNASPSTEAREQARPGAAGELRHSHPITAAHQRIFRENGLIGRLNAAMDLGDFEELRRVNARYRDEYPEDDHQLQDAYDLIASCQEQQTEVTREAAVRFRNEHRSSTLRRYLRRYCLE